jgi:acyl carrier protein
VPLTALLKKKVRKTMSTARDRVKDIIAKHLGVDRNRVTEDANFIDELGADSLDTVELAMSFEDEFGCEIPEDAADSMSTVGDIIKFLETTARVDISRLPQQRASSPSSDDQK